METVRSKVKSEMKVQLNDEPYRGVQTFKWLLMGVK